ncbi:DgyrCDS12842 [Dimorphilus gyrociliatus]|uniref:DgyrCDS12842 n=1 Tax=Dimorphilus gyrociliatus TaxID=2664684 RepID=A0A7I8W8X7_9ANNE|nr:DgyrCDS12842 [Dimorphilus gyrociliatus]
MEMRNNDKFVDNKEKESEKDEEKMTKVENWLTLIVEKGGVFNQEVVNMLKNFAKELYIIKDKQPNSLMVDSFEFSLVKYTIGILGQIQCCDNIENNENGRRIKLNFKAIWPKIRGEVDTIRKFVEKSLIEKEFNDLLRNNSIIRLLENYPSIFADNRPIRINEDETDDEYLIPNSLGEIKFLLQYIKFGSLKIPERLQLIIILYDIERNESIAQCVRQYNYSKGEFESKVFPDLIVFKLNLHILCNRSVKKKSSLAYKRTKDDGDLFGIARVFFQFSPLKSNLYTFTVYERKQEVYVINEVSCNFLPKNDLNMNICQTNISKTWRAMHYMMIGISVRDGINPEPIDVYVDKLDSLTYGFGFLPLFNGDKILSDGLKDISLHIEKIPLNYTDYEWERNPRTESNLLVEVNLVSNVLTNDDQLLKSFNGIDLDAIFNIENRLYFSRYKFLILDTIFLYMNKTENEENAFNILVQFLVLHEKDKDEGEIDQYIDLKFSSLVALRVIVEGICRIFERSIVAEINIVVKVVPLLFKFILKSGILNFHVKNRNTLETYLQTLFLRIDNFIQNFRRNSKRVRKIGIKLINSLIICWKYLFPDEIPRNILEIHISYMSEMYCRLLTPDGISKSLFKEQDKIVYFEEEVFFEIDLETAKIYCLQSLIEEKEFSAFVQVRHEFLNSSIQVLFVSYLIYENDDLIKRSLILLQKLLNKRYELLAKGIELSQFEAKTLLECIKFLTRNVQQNYIEDKIAEDLFDIITKDNSIYKQPENWLVQFELEYGLDLEQNLIKDLKETFYRIIDGIINYKYSLKYAFNQLDLFPLISCDYLRKITKSEYLRERMLTEIFDIHHRSNNFVEKAFSILTSRDYSQILNNCLLTDTPTVDKILRDLQSSIESLSLGKFFLEDGKSRTSLSAKYYYSNGTFPTYTTVLEVDREETIFNYYEIVSNCILQLYCNLNRHFASLKEKNDDEELPESCSIQLEYETILNNLFIDNENILNYIELLSNDENSNLFEMFYKLFGFLPEAIELYNSKFQNTKYNYISEFKKLSKLIKSKISVQESFKRKWYE